MGICESCLGYGRRVGSSETDETSRLLGGPYQSPYGALGTDGTQTDMEDILRKKREALERLCISTSHKFVDVSNFSHLNHDTADVNGLTDIDKMVLDVFDPTGLSNPIDEGGELDEDDIVTRNYSSGNLGPGTSRLETLGQHPGFHSGRTQSQIRDCSNLESDPAEESTPPSSPVTSTTRDGDLDEDEDGKEFSGSSEENWLRQLMGQDTKGQAVWDVLALENLPLCVRADLWD